MYVEHRSFKIGPRSSFLRYPVQPIVFMFWITSATACEALP
jgi:hypothetical protein